MKKILTSITLIALVGTSASNLKPMFTNTITNHGFKSNKINNKDISITNENDTNPFTPKKVTSGIPNNVEIRSLLNTSNWGVYAGTSQGLYKSVDGINFTEIKGITNTVYKIQFFPNGTIYVLTYLSKPGMNEYTLYKSTNGINFTEISGIPSNLASCLGFATDGTIYAGTNGGLWKSTNGTDFKKINEFAIRTITFDNHGVIYVGTSQGLYKSVDGINFTEINETNKEVEWQHFLGLFFGRHLFLIFDRS